jgi:ABC-2 type transport system ATP-binding protein
LDSPDFEFAIETDRLTKVFRKLRAVDALNLRVPRGSFYGFLGPNGAGKSTTIKMLTGLLAPTEGDIRLLGMDVAAHPLEVKRRVGVVPEELCLFENLTGREYLLFIGRMYGLELDVVESRTQELFALLNLDAEDTRIAEFSHGMKKKVALSAALIHDPQLLFLDEPFEGIDAVTSRVIRETLGRLTARGVTIFLTSHILEIVEKLCTRVGIIRHGSIIAEGDLVELAADGSLESAFISAVSDAGAETRQLSWLHEAG